MDDENGDSTKEDDLTCAIRGEAEEERPDKVDVKNQGADFYLLPHVCI